MILKDKQIIVIDGSDGAGKETLSRGLAAYLNHIGLYAERFSFPMYDTAEGHKIAVLLGKTDEDAYSENKKQNAANVNNVFYKKLPENFLEENWMVASRIYATERAANIGKILNSPANVIICDRYSFSNMAYQSAKNYLKAQEMGMLSSERDFEWADYIMNDRAMQIADMEYNEFKIPEPNKTIFLYRPHEDAMKRVKDRGEKVDVHEGSKDYQFFVERAYTILATNTGAAKINTLDQNQQLRSRESIFLEAAGVVSRHLNQPWSQKEVNKATGFAKSFYASAQKN